MLTNRKKKQDGVGVAWRYIQCPIPVIILQELGFDDTFGTVLKLVFPSQL